MRLYLLKLCILIATLLVFVDCKKNGDDIVPEENTSTCGDRDPEAWLTLVKFTNDKYRDQIIAYKGTDSATMNWRCTYPPLIEELIVGTSPFTHQLPNGYWIMTWRWEDVYIYPTRNILLPYKWESFTHWSQKWPMPEDIVSFKDFIVEVGGVDRRTIDEHLSQNTNVKSGTEEYFFLYDYPVVHSRNYIREDDISTDEKEWYFTYVHQQDSLHEIYVQRLIDITNKGDFEKVYKKIYD